MNPYLSNHALVAYMLVGAPMVVWIGEMVLRFIERCVKAHRRERYMAMRRHPAGTARCECGAPLWNANVHASACRLTRDASGSYSAR